MATAAIYCRISKDEEGRQLGVDRQERLCRELAARRGLNVQTVLVDNDLSAMKRKPRPAFERLVHMMEAGEVDAVVAYHVDRLYRRTTDLERLVEIVEKHRAEVSTVAAGDIDLSTASGRMVARILGGIAQGESERIAERVRVKHDELAAAGRAPGGRAPYGYRWTATVDDEGRTHRRYAVEPTEAATVVTIARRILEGGSLLGIARELDAAGSVTREGRPWHPSTVRSVVNNPAVVALRIHRREIAGPGEWDPILDRATWEQVRAVLSDPARKHKRPPRDYMLSGLVKNPEGAPMNGRLDRGPGGERTRRTYATRAGTAVGGRPGPAMAIGADELEAVIAEAVLLRLDKEELPVDETPLADNSEVEAIEAEMAELAQLRGANTITLAEWLAARGPLQERLAVAKAATAATRRPAATNALLRKPKAVRKMWENATLSDAEMRQIIDAYIERITILPAKRARWTPIDERIRVDWRG